MAPVACREPEHDGLTGRGVTSVISYWPVSQKTYWHDASICLGENPTVALSCFDLCYSFKLPCWAEYGSIRQLHYAAKNYMRNYAYTTGEHPPQHIPYERALRNLTVLMFSHYINHLENTGALEGHRTLMMHECLTVASALGHFHRWQRRVEPGDRDKLEWVKVPVVNKGDFCYKYSTVLILMGSVQHPAYSHPKMLGHCFDNVYHQGQFIGDLPARGKNPTEVQTKRVYD